MSALAEWLSVIDPPRPGVENMRIDWLLLEQANASPEPLTAVRFYRWEKPTVSLGRNQQPEDAINYLHCRRTGIPVVTRPTGGRAVFHHEELTYSIVSNDPRYFPLGRVQETYHLVARALRAGLNILNIVTEFAPRPVRVPAGQDPGTRRHPCFSSPSRYELLSHGRKIAGSAQRCLKRSFLQHGSIPIAVNYEQMAAALGIEEGGLQKRLISISEASGRQVTFSQLCEALRQGFEVTFGIKWGNGVES